MYKKILPIFIVFILCAGLCGCASRGMPEQDPAAKGPDVDRSQIIDSMPGRTDNMVIPDYQGRAEEYAASRHIPEDLANEISRLKEAYLKAKRIVDARLEDIRSGLRDLDTSLPDWRLPDIEPITIPEEFND